MLVHECYKRTAGEKAWAALIIVNSSTLQTHALAISKRSVLLYVARAESEPKSEVPLWEYGVYTHRTTIKVRQPVAY